MPSLALACRLSAVSRASRRPFSPASLFSSGEQGVWYDPSDLSTLFQDAAGTIPVTAVEKPVGLMLDKSGRGNHATQSTTASRPVLSARYNLLTKTEQFDDAVWGKNAVDITANAVVAPDGTLTGDKLIENTTLGHHRIYYYNFVSQPPSVISIYAKAAERNLLAVSSWQSQRAVFDLANGVVSFGNGTIEPAPNGWYKCTYNVGPTNSLQPIFSLATSFDYTPSDAGGTQSYQGDGHSGLYIWGADLRVANDGVGLPAYQRVNTATDYDYAGFAPADVFDGVDDHEITAAGGGSTTAFFWCSSIRVGKVGAVQTLFSDTGTNTGYRVRINANQLELAAGNGSAYTTATTSDTLALGQRAVLTAWHDGTNLNVQINNGTVVQSAFATATAGTAQITIGKDNNAASSFFMGRLYEKVYLKDTVLSAANIAATKSFCAQKAKVTL